MTDREKVVLLLPGLPNAAPLSEAVLFGFDDWSFPFQDQVQTHLIPGQDPRLVLLPGPSGSHDEVVLYYGSVVRIGDTLHLWYNGNYGPLQNTIGYERVNCVICYATSTDGIHWQKPNLGLVEFNGSRDNNIVELRVAGLWSTCALVHDPDDENPDRRFKMAFEAQVGDTLRFCVAFSPDGLRWTPSLQNPVGPFCEMAGVAKHNGLFYLNGQSTSSNRKGFVRQLVTFVSSDFEHWSPCGAIGMDRSINLTGPSTDDHAHQYEEVHLGAALWNRGNVLLGLYGQWHGHPSGDRKLLTMDLGLALSHDGIHYHEPIPGFRIVPAREQPEAPLGFGPALMQGQGMENIGDQTLYWYSNWRGTDGNGVRVVSWQRDRLGMLKPFSPRNPRAISCPIQIQDGRAAVTINAGGLGEHARLRVNVLDEAFRPVPGYSGDDAAIINESGFDVQARWKAGNALLPSHGTLRLELNFEGVRPEDCNFHAAYIK